MKCRILAASGSARLLPFALCGVLMLAPLAMAETDPAPGDTQGQLGAAGAPSSDPPALAAQEQEQEQTFTIKRFVIEGSTLFTPGELARQVAPFTGRRRTAADVEGARDALERFFHDQGYPTVMVNIPEQAVQNKVIRLDIIENRVGTVTVTGNRWFSTEKIMRDLPSIAPGQVIHLPQLQSEANRLNRHPDFKMVPNMKPGQAPESVDMAVAVTDRSPWHGSLELSNRASHDTSELRSSGSLRYDNLWQREHSLSGTYQLSPQKPAEVQVASGSYTMPAPWDRDDKLVFYGVWSNSDTASGGGFKNLGKGYIFGTRAVVSLPAVGGYSHTAVFGLDYKDFQETTGLLDVEEGESKPVKYLPVSAAYSSALPDSRGVTSFNAGVNLSFREAISKPREFEAKRYQSRANYLFLTAGVDRNQRLPGDWSLLVRLDGQVSDQPLISNEQYVAGGGDSVRGYRESEGSGDNAVHGVLELSAPDLLGKPGHLLVPYLFFEGAGLWVKEPLPGQEDRIGLKGTGLGVRGTLFGGLEFQTDLAFALMDTAKTAAGDSRLHFKVKWQF